MKRMLAVVLACGIGSMGLVGCGDEASSKTETTVKTPEGTTKVTDKTSVNTSGSNPPAAGDTAK